MLVHHGIAAELNDRAVGGDAEKRGVVAAYIWYWLELLRCRPFLWRRLRRQAAIQATPRTTESTLASLTSDFRIALRQLKRHPSFAFAVITTLATAVHRQRTVRRRSVVIKAPIRTMSAPMA